MEENNGFVTLAHFSNAADAGMACELLVNNGIAAVLSGANFGALEPLPMIGGFSEIELLVHACDLEHAQELYDAFFNSEENSFPKFEIVSDE